MRAGGETWIVGSYDPDLDLTYWGIAQAKPWMHASRGTKVTDAALYAASTVALRERRRVARVALPARARRVARSRRGVRARARRHRRRESRLQHRQERAFSGSSIAGPASSSAHKETVFQNVYDSIDPKTGVTDLSRRHPRAEGRQVDPVVSEHRRRSQLAGDELSPGQRPARDSAQPVVHGDRRQQGGVRGRLGRHRRRSPLLRDAGQRRQRRQAGGLRRQDDERSVEPRAARRLSHRRADDGGRRRLHRRSRSLLPRVRRQDRRHALGNAARHVGAGLSRCRSAPAASSTSR